MHRVALLLLLLAGCAGQTGVPAGPDPARLTLLAPLVIPPESATLRLQYGQPVARNAVQEHDPFCVFELNTVSDSPQIVRADSFRVIRISHSVDTIAALPYPAPMRVGLFGVGLFDDHRPSHIYYKTLFWLRSERQPGVRVLTCMSNQSLPGIYPFMRHLTAREIRQALGAGFLLEVR